MAKFDGECQNYQACAHVKSGVWTQFSSRVRLISGWLLIAATLSVMTCVILQNFESFFMEMPRLRSEGEMFRDLAHLMIPAFCICLLAILFRYGVRFSASGFPCHKYCFIVIGVLILLPITVYLFGQKFGLASPSAWHIHYNYSFDDFLIHYGIVAGGVILLFTIFAVIRKKITLCFRYSGGSRAFFQCWPFQLLLFAALLLIPRWSGNYWLNLFNGEFIVCLPVFVWMPVLIYFLLTMVNYRRFCHSFVAPLALVNTVLLYLLLAGYWHSRIDLYGPLPSAVIPVVSASLVWSVFWWGWLNDGVALPTVGWLGVMIQWRNVAGLAGVLIIWQFVSYFTYADSRRQQIAIRFVERFSETEGICLDLQAIPASQREYMLSLFQSYGKKVFTDPQTFPKREQPAFASELKYPILHAEMKPAGLFLSKGNCGYYYTGLAAMGGDMVSFWFLGRWWHIYSCNIWVS